MCIRDRVYPGRAPSVQLVISKSKVAPLKVQLLLKLELCGATLLAELVSKVKNVGNEILSQIS